MCKLRVRLWAVSCLVMLFYQAQAQSYPSLLRVVSPGVGAPGDVFTPTFGGSVSDSTPAIAEWTRTAGPDETIVLSGSNLSTYSGTEEGKDTRFWVYGSGGVKKEARIKRLDKDKAVITLDKDMPQWSMYLIWPANEAGTGTPIAINKTDGWWVGPNKTTKGSTVSVFGRNLAHGNVEGTSNSYVYIKALSGSSSQWASVTKVNPYKVDFTVPSTLSNGDYEVWVHNGHGGEYGWSGPLKLTIYEGAQWSYNIFNVKNYGAKGDGISDDRTAINNALLAAGSYGNTIFFPAGTYMVSGALNLKSNTKWTGDVDVNGKAASAIKLQPGFVSGGSGLMGGGRLTQVLFENLKIVRNGQNLSGHELMDIRDAHMIWWKNCELDARGADALRIAGVSSHIYLKNTTIIGGANQWGSLMILDAPRQVFMDSCTLKMTNDCGAAINNKGVIETSMTNCIIKDLDNTTTDGSGWGKGRIWSHIGAGGAAYHCYFGANLATGLGTRQSGTNLPDPNSGEIFLWEGNFAETLAIPTAVSSNSITLPIVVSSTTVDGNPNRPKIVTITKGRGAGQWRRIISYEGNKLVLDHPWEVLPDTKTSLVIAGNFVEKIALYKNQLDANGKDYIANQSWDYSTASAGVEPFGGCFDFIADNNSFTGLRRGISTWATQHSFTDPNYFCLYTNNKFINCRYALHIASGADRANEGTAMLGITFRNNTIQKAIESAIHADVISESYPLLSTMTYEHNNFSEVPKGFSVGTLYRPGSTAGAKGFENQIFYKNSFNGSGTAIVVSPKIAMRENTFQGFSSLYSGLVTTPVIEASYHVTEINGVPGGSIVKTAFSIKNSGSSPLSWQLTKDATWLNVSAFSGVIPSQGDISTIELAADPKGLTAGTYKANLKVVSETLTRMYTVVFQVKDPSASLPPQIALIAPSATSFTAPATITITASASDADGSISKVEFFSGATKIGEAATAPYSIQWNPSDSGTYVLTAKATDDGGLSTSSEGVSIKVTKPVVVVPVAPAINLITPLNGSSYTEGTTITVTASAADADGSISKVEFFSGATKIGEALSAPYSIQWNPSDSGTYVLTAKATDDGGLFTSSQEVKINVADPSNTGIACEGRGQISWEYWTGVEWKGYLYIPENQQPADTKLLSSFSTPEKVSDYYAGRVRGYICPPESGYYTFYLTADDLGGLWLSTDENPDNKQKIASVDKWTNVNQYNKYPSQESKEIYLESGRRYYVEATYIEETGLDHLSVGWKMPNGKMEKPIDGRYLIPFANSTMNTRMITIPNNTAQEVSVEKVSPLTQDKLLIYPNPFRDQTVIEFSLTEQSNVSLQLFNQQGALVKTIYQGRVNNGTTKFTLNAGNLSNGVYICRLVSDKKTTLQQQIILLK